MRQWQAVQQFPRLPPLRHIGIYQSNESLVVMPLQQVREFMGDDVFEAGRRLLGKVGVQPDVSGDGVQEKGQAHLSTYRHAVRSTCRAPAG